jgi:hypothetical protein
MQKYGNTVPGAAPAGTVQLHDPPEFTVPESQIPVSLVDVWGRLPTFCHVIVVPGCTVISADEKKSSSIATTTVPGGGGGGGGAGGGGGGGVGEGGGGDPSVEGTRMMPAIPIPPGAPWKMQKYGNAVPGAALIGTVQLHEPPELTVPESQIPVSLVDVCGRLPMFCHVIVVPGCTVISADAKKSSSITTTTSFGADGTGSLTTTVVNPSRPAPVPVTTTFTVNVPGSW